MAWATTGQVAGLAAAVARPTDAAEVAAVLALCHEARVPVTAAGGRSGVCGASVPAARRRRPRPHRRWPGSSTSTARRWCSTCCRARSATSSSTTCGPTTASRVGHWPQSMALSTVGGWLACRGAGQLSGRYGKIEDIVLGLDVVLADGTRDHDRRLAPGRGRARPHPAVRRAARARSASSPAPACGSTAAPARERRGAWLLGSFDAGLDVMRRVVQRGAHPAVLRLYDAVEADRTYGTGDKALLLALDEGDGTVVDATFELLAEECLRAGGHRGDEAHVEHWLAHRNDVAALEALTSKGYVVDTMEVAGSWADLPTIYRATLDALLGRRGHDRRLGPPVAQLPDGGCLYFTFAGQVDADRRDAYYRELWDAGQRAVLAHGGALEPPPRRRAQPRPVHGRGARPRPRGARGDQGGARPARHPQPGQARAAVAVGRRRRAGDARHPDIGQTVVPCTAEPKRAPSSSSTSARPACGPRSCAPTRRSPPCSTGPVLPSSPAPGLVEFDAAALADAALDVARARAGRRRAGRRRRHHQPAGVHDRLGPGHRRAGRPRPRLAGPAHGRRLPLWQGRGAALRARTSRPPRPRGCSTTADPDRTRDLCFGTVDTWLAWHLSGGDVHVTDPTNAAVTGLLDGRRHRLGRQGARRAAHPAPRRCPRSSTRAGSSARRRALAGRAADRRARRRPAGVARRPGLRRAGLAKITFGTGGMLDVCVGPERADRPTARAPTARSRSSPGAGAATTTWGVEAIMLAAGTNVEWLRDDLGLIDTRRESTTSPPRCDDDRRRRVRARAARPRHAPVGLRRPGHAARHHPRHGRGRRSCGPCSRASPSAAPTWSRPPRPTPGWRSTGCASTAA